MTTTDTMNDYRTTIDDLATQQRRLGAARAELTRLQHELTVREAMTVLAGLEGSNEAQRKANLTLTLEADGDYRAITTSVVALQHEVADADAEATAAREFCRLLRLQLALAVSDGAKEGVFA